MYENYTRDCLNKTKDPNNTQWIVANFFNNNVSNEMVKNATNFTKSRIDGIIFISDRDITSERKYDHPRLIAIAPTL